MRKNILRKLYRNIKTEYLQSNHHQYYPSLCFNLRKLISEQQLKASIIGSYLHVPLKEIIPPYLAQKTYSFPFFTKNSKNMSFHLHQPTNYFFSKNHYKAGDFFIKIPHSTDQQVNPEIVLVPLTVFNNEKQRIGQGGGYYDTYIKSKRERNENFTFIGVGLQCCKIEEKDFHEKHDQILDYIITQRGIYK